MCNQPTAENGRKDGRYREQHLDACQLPLRLLLGGLPGAVQGTGAISAAVSAINVAVAFRKLP